MTELEQARAHLRRCQDRFHHRRALGVGDVVREEAEAAVLAALSWVWDAQEREKHIRLCLSGCHTQTLRPTSGREEQMGTITDSKGNMVGEFADTLEDWKQVAQVEASNRRELQIENAKLIGWLRRHARFNEQLTDRVEWREIMSFLDDHNI